MLSMLRGNPNPFQNRHSKYAEHTQNKFHRWLSICGTNFITGWAYAERISSLTEHMRKQFHRPVAEHAWKYLKVEYLGRIEHNFQKSRVTGPWDHKDSVSAKKYFKNFLACVPLKGDGNEPVFSRCFCINRFGLGPLHYLSSRSDFDFEFSEIFVFENLLPASVSKGVDKIAWSIHITDAGSRRLFVSSIQRVFFKKIH